MSAHKVSHLEQWHQVLYSQVWTAGKEQVQDKFQEKKNQNSLQMKQ